MFVSTNGLSIPALELRVNWAAFLGQNGSANVPRIQEAAAELATAVLASGLSYYDGFARGTISTADAALSLVVSEPITLDSVFVAPADGTRYQVGTVLFKAPAGKVNKNAVVDAFSKTWYETALHRYASLCVHAEICKQLGATKNGRNFATRETQIRSQIVQLGGRLQMPYVPTAIYSRSTAGLLVSTPGYVWADPVSRAVHDHALVSAQALSVLVASFAEEARSQVTAVVKPKLDEISQSLSFAVNIDKATARTLTGDELASFRAMAASLSSMPLVALDIIGTSAKTFSMDAMIGQLTALSAALKAQEDVNDVIDVDVTPRSMAELIYAIDGSGRFSFLDSVDAFYRRKELPTLDPSVPLSLAQIILTVHPSLVASARVLSDRQVSYSYEGSDYIVNFPDRLGTGYSFTVTEGDAQARATLEKLNSFVQTAFVVVTGDERISPLVLKQMGVSSVQRGASFALNGAP